MEAAAALDCVESEPALVVEVVREKGVPASSAETETMDPEAEAVMESTRFGSALMASASLAAIAPREVSSVPVTV